MVSAKSRNNLAIIRQSMEWKLECKMEKNASSFDVGKWFFFSHMCK